MTPAPASNRHALWAPVLTWLTVGVLLLAAAASAVGSLNRDLYSAAGFVERYLSALADHNAAAALALPGAGASQAQLAGAGLPPDASRVLLRNSMTGDIRNITILSDQETAAGVHSVSVGYLLDGKRLSSTFLIERRGELYALFATWQFARSPLAAITLTVQHESIFEVNGLTLDTRSTSPDQPAGFSNTTHLLVFSPGRYVFSHKSRLLAAKPVGTIVTEPGSVSAVTVDAKANEHFVQAVQTELDSYLDECASQQVLLPTGCPFGEFIEDRLIGTPEWSISQYPPVSLIATDQGWVTTDVAGSALLSAEVQSLFDGTVSTLNEDVGFTISLTVGVRPDGSLDIRVE